MTKCTCGKCIGGFLSPNNAAALREAATSSAEVLRDSLPNFPGGQSLHDPEVYLLDYVPPELRIEVKKAFADGYANCMDSIAYLLKQGQAPKPKMVAQCASIVPGADKEATRKYFELGGLPEYALDAVLAQCETGTGESEVPEASGPVCGNDGNWELLRQHLFSNSGFWPCGPYPMDDEGGDDSGDGWTYYDTSNWVAPNKTT